MVPQSCAPLPGVRLLRPLTPVILLALLAMCSLPATAQNFSLTSTTTLSNSTIAIAVLDDDLLLSGGNRVFRMRFNGSRVLSITPWIGTGVVGTTWGAFDTAQVEPPSAIFALYGPYGRSRRSPLSLFLAISGNVSTEVILIANLITQSLRLGAGGGTNLTTGSGSTAGFDSLARASFVQGSTTSEVWITSRSCVRVLRSTNASLGFDPSSAWTLASQQLFGRCKATDDASVVGYQRDAGRLRQNSGIAMARGGATTSVTAVYVAEAGASGRIRRILDPTTSNPYLGMLSAGLTTLYADGSAILTSYGNLLFVETAVEQYLIAADANNDTSQAIPHVYRFDVDSAGALRGARSLGVDGRTLSPDGQVIGGLALRRDGALAVPVTSPTPFVMRFFATGVQRGRPVSTYSISLPTKTKPASLSKTPHLSVSSSTSATLTATRFCVKPWLDPDAQCLECRRSKSLNATSRCTECQDVRLDPNHSVPCGACLGPFVFPDCRQCQASPLLDRASGCSACVNRNYDPHDRRNPANSSEQPDPLSVCRRCINPALAFPNCTTCAESPLLNPADGCNTCLSGKYVLPFDALGGGASGSARGSLASATGDYYCSRCVSAELDFAVSCDLCRDSRRPPQKLSSGNVSCAATAGTAAVSSIALAAGIAAAVLGAFAISVAVYLTATRLLIPYVRQKLEERALRQPKEQRPGTPARRPSDVYKQEVLTPGPPHEAWGSPEAGQDEGGAPTAAVDAM